MKVPTTVWILGRPWTLKRHAESIPGAEEGTAGLCDTTRKTIHLWTGFADIPSAFWHEAYHAGLYEVSNQKDGLDEEHACNTLTAVTLSVREDPRNEGVLSWLEK